MVISNGLEKPEAQWFEDHSMEEDADEARGKLLLEVNMRLFLV
jgi:hypothetical protein